jgi:hypothetical protein
MLAEESRSSSASTQPVVMVCTANSRHAPKPGPPMP